MVENWIKKGDVTANYLESVFDRNGQPPPALARGVAIPHGNMTEINESRIVVANFGQAHQLARRHGGCGVPAGCKNDIEI